MVEIQTNIGLTDEQKGWYERMAENLSDCTASPVEEIHVMPAAFIRLRDGTTTEIIVRPPGFETDDD